jgi:hypothetical protein
MDKKGDLSINIIIVAAIALLILVIIAVLLFRNVANPLSDNCMASGGKCVESCEDLNTDTDTYTQHSSAKCGNRPEVCCVRISA